MAINIRPTAIKVDKTFGVMCIFKDVTLINIATV